MITRKFSKSFMSDIGELLAMCVMNDTDTLEIEFVSKSGIQWKVKMTFTVIDEQEKDDD